MAAKKKKGRWKRELSHCWADKAKNRVSDYQTFIVPSTRLPLCEFGFFRFCRFFVPGIRVAEKPISPMGSMDVCLWAPLVSLIALSLIVPLTQTPFGGAVTLFTFERSWLSRAAANRHQMPETRPSVIRGNIWNSITLSLKSRNRLLNGS